MYRRALAVAASLALFAAACGSDDAEDGSSATAETEQESTAPDDESEAPESTEADSSQELVVSTENPDEAAAEAGLIDRDGTLRLSYSTGPVSFDPSKAASTFDSPSLFLTYDRVVHMDPNAEIVPGIAESWEFNDDGSELTFKIRPGITFHDGNPVDAAAVVANLERNREGTASGDLAVIETFEVVDDLTFTLGFSGPAGAFPAILSDRPGAIASPAAFGDGLDLQPVGSGMYKVVEYQKDSRIVYERNEDYWDPDAVGAARVEFNIIRDNVAALNALKGGQIDFGVIIPSQISEVESAGFNLIQGVTLNVHHLQFNRTREFLDDVNVRRAISMALDREGMVEGVLLGAGAVSSQPFPAGYWGHNPDIELPPYDPETARQMLRDAGVTEGQTYEVVAPNTNVYPALAQVAKDNLSEVGINLEIRLVDPVQAVPVFYAQADGDMFMSVYGGRTDPAQHLPLLYGEGTLPNPGSATWPPLDEVLPDVVTPGSIEERTPAVHEASRIVSDDAVNAILHHPAGLFAYTDQVVGAEHWLIGRPEFRGMGLAAN